MKKNPLPKSGVAVLRVVVASTLCLGGALMAALSFAGTPSSETTVAVGQATSALPPAAASALGALHSKFPFDPRSADGGATPLGPATQRMQSNPVRRNTVLDAMSRSMPFAPLAGQTQFDPILRSGSFAATASSVPFAPTPGAMTVNDADAATAAAMTTESAAGEWSLFPSPNVDGRVNTLSDVACVSSSDCWAVGHSAASQNTSDPQVNTLILHWDGSAWSIVASPNGEAGRASRLYGVTCTSASSCWAVGYSGNSTSSTGDFEQTLTLRWDGTSWSVVPSPSVEGSPSLLFDVTCASASDCWAVGWYTAYNRISPFQPKAGYPVNTLTMRWNGTAWAIVPSPNVLPSISPSIESETQSSALAGVTCNSSSDCWAVGSSYVVTYDPYTEVPRVTSSQTLTMRWNGAAWVIVSSPNSTSFSYLAGVTCTSASDCWAVGLGMMHWDGSSWTVVETGGVASAVTCVSASDCWAVAYLPVPVRGTYRMLIRHWDGSSWSTTPSPDIAGTNERLFGVACVATLDCWSVGSTESGLPVIVRYAPRGSPTPTPSPTATPTASPSSTPAPSPTASASPFPTASPIPTAEPTDWSIVRTPNVRRDRPEHNHLNNITCVSASDCWAVGYSDDTPSDPFRTLIERWDGRSWSIVPSPNVDGISSFLGDVTCTSSTDCWAVGGVVGDGSSRSDKTLILRWDGTSWSMVPSPNTDPREGNNLSAVTCASSSDCWAVGSRGGGPSTLIMRWDGMSWKIVSSPPGSAYSRLEDVTCVSGSDCWAVGTDGSRTMHWDGTSWTIVPSPRDGGPTTLSSVTCASASDCWAVGYASSQVHNSPDYAVIQHWDGTSWSIVPSTDEPRAYFTAVTCVSAADCWAVGGSGSALQDLVMRWDGTSWAKVSAPSSVGAGGLACVAGSDCWAVGNRTENSGHYQTFTEHWDGSSWSIVGSPNTRGGKQTNVFNAATCISESDCWAVGYWNTGFSPSRNFPGFYDIFDRTLIQRWNGTSWSIIPSPNLESRNAENPSSSNVLTDVTCVSESDCWAVGYFESAGVTNASTRESLILRWDGNSWTVVPSPNIGTYNSLTSVSCASASDCWAVGYQFARSPDGTTTFAQTFILRWDGRVWTVVQSPNTISSKHNLLYDVACTSASNCWAVGYANTSDYRQPLIERWDGNFWSIVSSAKPTGTLDNVLYSVACTSDSECWTVGYSGVSRSPKTGALTSSQTLVERWNGTSWAVVPSGNVNSSELNFLSAVSCTADAKCWAVGDHIFNGGDLIGTRVGSLVERWDGASWAVVPSSNISATESNRPVAVTCASPSDCWAFGIYGGEGTVQTVAWNYTPGATTLSLVGVVSQKMHGSAGSFDINLPLTGNVGIEPRKGGADGDYTLVFSFANPLTSVTGASVTSGIGRVSSRGFDSTDARKYIVNLTGVTNAQVLTVSLSNVSDSAGNSSASVSASIGVLIGDVNATGAVDGNDVSAVQGQTRRPVNLSTFRYDVNGTGVIDGNDVSITQSKTRTRLP